MVVVDNECFVLWLMSESKAGHEIVNSFTNQTKARVKVNADALSVCPSLVMVSFR